MKKKVGIFTQYHMQPEHPRIKMEQEILIKSGFQVDIIHPNNKKYRGLLYYLTLTFFNWKLILQYKKLVKQYNTIIIYDLALLPLACFIDRTKTKLIYETIDHNVWYSFHGLTCRFKPFILLKPIIPPIFTLIEKWLIKKYIHIIIVNSTSLYDSFLSIKKPIILNYYTSPLENLTLSFPFEYKPAFLFLGRIGNDKGIYEMLQLSEKYQVPLFIFGKIDKNINLSNKKNKLLHIYNRLTINELKEELIKISHQYALIGLSLVPNENKSAALQELNKEIDYLALGIPIIGNNRYLTKQKINSGCGINISEKNELEKILISSDEYLKLAENSRKYYHQFYRFELFEMKIHSIFLLNN